MKTIHPFWLSLCAVGCAIAAYLCLSSSLSERGARPMAFPGKMPHPPAKSLQAGLTADPESTFHELKIYNGEGHPWRSAIEDWTGAKRKMNNDPLWAAWLVKERAEVDAWIKRFPSDHVEWACGYYHAFVSPRDGSTLIWTPAIPGRETDHLSSATDPNVKITPDIAEAWVYGFRTRHADMLRRAAWLYRLTSDEHYAVWASAQLDYYAAHYSEWRSRPRNLGAHLTWQPLDEAGLCLSYAEAVRVLSNYAGSARILVWKKGLFVPIVAVLNRNYLQIHNIGLWCRAAAAEVALVFHDEPAWREALDGEFGVRAQFAKGVTADYLWHEQSFGYNSFVISAAKSLFTAAGIYGRARELSHEMAVCENLMLAPIYLRFPSGRLPHPADDTGWSMKPCPDLALFKSTYRVFPTVSGLEEANKVEGRDWNTLLDPPPLAPEKTTLPDVATCNLESTRMAVLRNGPWQVFFHYGQLTKSHAKPEALNFEAAYGLVDITHNTGVVGYMSPMNAWFRSSMNYNVPLIDGKGQDEPARGDLLESSESVPRISARQNYGGGGQAQRTMELHDGTLLDTVELTTKSARRQLLGLALHLQGQIVLPPNFLPDPDFSKRSGPFAYWKHVKVATFRDRAEFDVNYASIVLRVTLSTPGTFRVWSGFTPDQPDTTAGQRAGFYLELEAPSAKAVFTTTFALAKTLLSHSDKANHTRAFATNPVLPGRN